MKKSDSGMVPISKLRGVSPAVRVVLKGAHLNTSSQLLAAAGRLEGREFLAASCRLDLPSLTRLVQRADLARVVGVGATFGLLLENLGIDDVASLAEQTPESSAGKAARVAYPQPTDPALADRTGGPGLDRAGAQASQAGQLRATHPRSCALAAIVGPGRTARIGKSDGPWSASQPCASPINSTRSRNYPTCGHLGR